MPTKAIISLKTYLKLIFNQARKFFFEKKENSKIILLSSNEEKTNNIKKRLDFYLPLANYKIEVKDSLSLCDIISKPVIIADQSLISKKALKLFDNIFDVDYAKNPIDGWGLCSINQYFFENDNNDVFFQERLCNVISKLKIKDKAYIFGTGTSLEKAISHDFSDGHVIVCNTIVRDPELWHHLKPDFIVAADAIYHFGHTEFAKTFRSDLKNRLLESPNTYFIYPKLFHGIVFRELGTLSTQLIPIPTGIYNEINTNLCKNFSLPRLGNILNILLLPLGCTLSNSIWLWGFDGRAPDDKLFWSNSKKHSYPELMDELLKTHPAFYEHLVPKGNENSYVKSVHGDELDIRMQKAEAKGYSFIMMHPSWTKTLNKRFNAKTA